MHVPGKGLRLLSEFCHMLHHILFHNDWADWIPTCWDGSGWAGQRWLSSSTRSELTGVRVRLLSVVAWLSFCVPLSFFSDVSVHQWLMSPRGTWLIFHLQPASQLLSEHEHTALNNMISAPQRLCGFWSVQRLMYHMPRSLHESSLPLYSSLCLFLFYTLGWDSGVTDQSRLWLCLVFAMHCHAYLFQSRCV